MKNSSNHLQYVCGRITKLPGNILMLPTFALLSLAFTSCNQSNRITPDDLKKLSNQELVAQVIGLLESNDIRSWETKNELEIRQVGLFSSMDYRFGNDDKTFYKSSRLGNNGCITNECWIKYDSVFPTILCTWWDVHNEKTFEDSHLGEVFQPDSVELEIRGITKDSVDYYEVRKDNPQLTVLSRKYLERAYIMLQKYQEDIEKKSVMYD